MNKATPTHKKNSITITEIRLFTDEQAVGVEKYFKVRYLVGTNLGEKIGQSTNTDMFAFMKEIVAVEFASGLLEENKIKAMSYDEFAKSKYGINFNTDIEPLHTVAVKDLKRVVETLKKYEDQWQGIQNLTEAFQQMYMVADQDEEQNQLSRLVNRMFDKSVKWAPENQGQSNYSGICWGAEINFRAYTAIGNWFLEGYIEDVFIRVYKDHANLGVFTTLDKSDWPEHYDDTFHVDDKVGFLKFLKDKCQWRVQVKG